MHIVVLARRLLIENRAPASRTVCHVVVRWINPGPACMRARFVSATLRFMAPCRPQNSSRIRTLPWRMASSIRAISGLTSASNPEGRGSRAQLSSTVPARFSSSQVRVTATTSILRPRSLNAFQRLRCAAPQERSAVVVS